jgi:hypothetical protein
MNSPAITIVNDRREFTFTEIINGTFRKWPIAAMAELQTKQKGPVPLRFFVYPRTNNLIAPE